MLTCMKCYCNQCLINLSFISVVVGSKFLMTLVLLWHCHKITIVSLKPPTKLKVTDNEYPVLHLLGFIKYLAEKALGPHPVSGGRSFFHWWNSLAGEWKQQQRGATLYEKLICAELNILLIFECEVISLDALLFTFQHLEKSKQAAERNCNINLLLKYFFLWLCISDWD